MANFAKEAIISVPAGEVPVWVKDNRIAAYTQCILATMVIYDASE